MIATNQRTSKARQSYAVMTNTLCRAAFVARSLLAIETDELNDLLAELPDGVLSEICNAATEPLPCDAARRVAVALCRYELALLDEQLSWCAFSPSFYGLARELHIREATSRLRYAARFASNNPKDPSSASRFLADVEIELGL
jgi:hypothetical protein